MTPIYTILVDSYRILKARALFWVTLGISGFVALMYLSIGFNESGMSLLFGLVDIEHSDLRKGSPMAELVYIGIFTKFIVPLWITWVAVILGLISTASIFPDFMADGAIELSLSKPIRRVTIFLSKYVGSLLFMVLQIGLFTLVVFIALRLRIGTWNPSVLWVIPLAVLVFSYLYAVVVLCNVLTRSTLPGILGALLIWLLSFLMNAVEGNLYAQAFTPAGDMDPEMQESLKPWHGRALMAYSVLPKTKQTMEFGDRLVSVNGVQGFSSETFSNLLMGDLAKELSFEGVDETMTRNSGWYVIGTSLLFEGVVVLLAGWIFCRRDF